MTTFARRASGVKATKLLEVMKENVRQSGALPSSLQNIYAQVLLGWRASNATHRLTGFKACESVSFATSVPAREAKFSCQSEILPASTL
jgi:hypothetical protein